jgi:two-component system phosphate regulon sensor histidine kinase PhoR
VSNDPVVIGPCPSAGRPDRDSMIDLDSNNSFQILAQAFYSHPLMVVISTPAEGRIIEVNDAFIEYLGYRRNEIIGRTARELRLYEDDSLRECLLSRLQKEGSVKDLTTGVRSSDGRIIQCRFSVQLIESCHEKYLLINMEDVTAETAAAAELKRLNNFLMAVRSIHHLIIREKEPAVLLRKVCSIFVNSLGFQICWAVNLNENPVLVAALQSGKSFNFEGLKEQLCKRQYPVCVEAVLRNRRTVSLITGQSMCQSCPNKRQNTPGDGVLLSPLVYNDTAQGIVAVILSAGTNISRQEKALISDLSADLGLALYNIKVERQKSHTETQLSASEERFKHITEVTHDVIYSILAEPKLAFEFISPSIKQILGYEPRELENNIDWILHNIHPDDLPVINTPVGQPEVRNTGTPIVLRWKHQDGHYVHIEHSYTVVYDDDGKIKGFIGVGRDISERIRQEAQLRLDEMRLESLLRLSQYETEDVQSLLNYALHEVISLTGSKIGYIYHYSEEKQEFRLNTWSKGVYPLCKIQSPPEVYYLKNTGIWGEVVRQRKPILINDYKVDNPLKKGYPEGHADLSRFLSIPVFVDKRIVAVVGVANKTEEYDQSDIRQITLLMDYTWKLVERRMVEGERLKAARKIENLYKKEKKHTLELQEEAKARGLFIDVLAHELRTPLTPVMVSAGMLQDLLIEGDEIKKRLAANLFNSSINLSRRLEELLDLARYARGTFKLHLKAVSLSQYIYDVVERFRPGLMHGNQTLTVNIEPELPEAMVDTSRLEQVLINLLSNAVKFSQDDGNINLNAAAKSGWLLVDVTDDGIGIAPEDQKRLFQPYHRVEQDRQKYPGIGLGLAVSKQIIEAHGGRVWLSSKPGKGSTFSFSIPVRTPDSRI